MLDVIFSVFLAAVINFKTPTPQNKNRSSDLKDNKIITHNFFPYKYFKGETLNSKVVSWRIYNIYIYVMAYTTFGFSFFLAYLHLLSNLFS
jgi:hypothetical protein